MGWEPLPSESITLADILSERGYVTAAVVDTPYYIRDGMISTEGFRFLLQPEPGRLSDSREVQDRVA